MRNLIALILAALAIASAGCQTREPVVTQQADGRDVACTAGDFDRLTANLDGPHLEPLTESPQHQMEVDPQRLGDLRFRVTLGLYDSVTNTAYYVCRDPAHPTAEEHLALMHEWCHRADEKRGWAISGPMWAALPRRMRTHPEIERHLRADGLIK